MSLITKQASCPKHGTNTTFITSAHVMQDWEVDASGNFVAVVDECVEISSDPDFDNIWTCKKCGMEAIIC